MTKNQNEPETTAETGSDRTDTASAADVSTSTSTSTSTTDDIRDHGRTVCTDCAPALEFEKGRAVDIYAAVKLITSYGDEWECLWRSLDDRRGAVVVLSLMAEQMCQELAHHQQSTVEKVWGRLVADQFRDLPSLQPAQEKTAPNVVRQAEKAAAVGA